MDKSKIKVGSEVAFNTLPDAAWFEVLEINGFQLTLREAGTDYAAQFGDTSSVKQVRQPTPKPYEFKYGQNSKAGKMERALMQLKLEDADNAAVVGPIEQYLAAADEESLARFYSIVTR